MSNSFEVEYEQCLNLYHSCLMDPGQIAKTLKICEFFMFEYETQIVTVFLSQEGYEKLL